MVRRLFKRIVLFCAGYSGLLYFFRFIHRKKIVIFALHGVVEEKDYPWKTIRKQCSLSRFDQVLSVLPKYFEFISLDEAMAMISGSQPVRPYCAVLTFDDGYRNNYLTALPILEKYGTPATFFLSTGHITKAQPLWFDLLDYVIQDKKQHLFFLNIGEVDVCFALDDQKQVTQQYLSFLYQYNKNDKDFQENDLDFQEKLYSRITHIQMETGEKISSTLRHDSRTAMMTWEEAAKAVQTGYVTIGSHTVDHLKLATLDEKQIRQQLRNSKEDIEKYTDRPCMYLCYPNGSVDDRVIRIVSECGYKAAVTTVSALNAVGCDVFQLARIGFPLRAEKFHIFNHVYRGR